MKYLFSIILSAGIFFSAAAQTSKGSFMLGGSSNILGGFAGAAPNVVALGFGKNKIKINGETFSSNYTIYNIAPNVGYFVADGWLIGINLGLLGFGGDDDFFDSESYLTMTPFVRYYFNNTAKTRPFGELRFGVINNTEDDSATLLGAKAGAAIFLNPKVSLDFFLDYSTAFDKENDQKYSQNVFGLGLGFNFFL